MFFRLGAVNAWRNLARSILAVVSMAVAAAFLTYTISLSRGYVKEAFAAFREVLGGEIVVYAQKVQGELPEGDSYWNFSRPTENPFTDLAVFHPEIYQQGYLESNQQTVFTAEDLRQMAESKGVNSVSPLYRLPGFTVLSKDYRYESVLRGRDLAKENDLNNPARLLYDGRWFIPEDDGELVAVISTKQDLPQGMAVPEVGSKINLEIPTLKIDQNGAVVLDYANPIQKTVTVIGRITVPTRTVTWQGEINTNSEQLYWWTNEIQLPLATWQEIWQQAGKGVEYIAAEATIQVDDMAYLEDIVLNLAQNFSNFSFVSVPNQAEMAMGRQLIEKFQAVPAETITGMAQNTVQEGMALDLRLPMMGLVLLNAALLVAANMLIMINERKREMAILKSVGAKRVDIVIMALTEALILSLVGASVGFLIFRLPGALNQMTNHQGFFVILQSVVKDFAQVGAATGAVSLIFGLLPALKLAAMPVMNVLRNE